ncbi:nuclear factor 1 A-type protein [Perilla frutescens var. hirtella]|uniref:Nuclear factor 1 A-type protein n=1 Tax=Perilla frutescens var. hirtella TaxID=608512 RepID=A0AAD4NZ00_PERFH|nr:nuclear factor 1 A-type protein [Perilla frutescens var. hirtella]
MLIVTAFWDEFFSVDAHSFNYGLSERTISERWKGEKEHFACNLDKESSEGFDLHDFPIQALTEINLRANVKGFVTEMDPQAFIRLSIGCLGLRVPGTELTASKSGIDALSFPCVCEIRLRGFPVQTTPVPFIPSPEATPNSHSIASCFYLEESDLKALQAPGCFYTSSACLEIVVFTGRKGTHCGVGAKRHQIGTFKLDVGPEWREGKPVVLFNGWIGIGKNRQESRKQGVELHLRVKLDPDPRYVFQFEDETKLSPQIVQLQGTITQPIFSCKFSEDRVSQGDQVSSFWSSSADQETERRERKGWKVKIHDLSGSAVAAAFITTPFVPSTGCDWVAKSNPGAWLIVRPDTYRSESWQPWGKLEAWREKGGVRDFICCRFRLLSDGQEGGELLMSEILINAEKGGEFFIDTDRHAQATAASPVPSSQSSGDLASLSPVPGGFVMCCRVQGEGKCSKPLVHLAIRHVTCVEDAAIFMALAAAVDLSIEACRPFRRKIRRGSRHS